jgi:hypothetical protein
MAWLTVHIFYLIDFRNRVVVLVDWAWAYFAYRRGSRLITGHRLDAGTPRAAVPSTSAAVPSTSAAVPSTSAAVPSTSAAVPSTSATATAAKAD